MAVGDPVLAGTPAVSASTSAETSRTWAFTHPGGDRPAVFAAIVLRTPNSNEVVSGVTFDSAALTKVADVVVTGQEDQFRVYIYVLVNPTTGAEKNFIASFTSGRAACVGWGMTDVDQTTPTETTALSSTSATAKTITGTVSTGYSRAIAVLGKRNSATDPASSGLAQSAIGATEINSGTANTDAQIDADILTVIENDDDSTSESSSATWQWTADASNRFAIAVILPLVTPNVAQGAAAAVSHDSSPFGIIAMGKEDVAIGANYLSDASIHGVSLRTTWATVQPTSAAPSFTALIAELDRLASAGKFGTVRIVTNIGRATTKVASWAQSGVATFPRLAGDNILVFWDTTYLERKKQLFAAAATAFGSHAALRGISVSFVSANTDDWNIPHDNVTAYGSPSLTEHARWLSATYGYTAQRVIDLGKEWITHVGAHFPANVALMLSIAGSGTMDGVSTYIAREVADWGYKAFPRRFMIQRNALSATSPDSGAAGGNDQFQLIDDYKKYGIGFQTLWRVTNPDQGAVANQYRMNSGTPWTTPDDDDAILLDAVNSALTYSPRFVEFYRMDLSNTTVRAAWEAKLNAYTDYIQDVFGLAPGRPAIQGLTNSVTTTNATSYTSASVTFPAGSLAYAFIQASHGTAAEIPTTVTTAGLTWTRHSTIITVAGGARVTLYTARVGAAAVTGTVAFGFGSTTHTGAAWQIGYIRNTRGLGSAVAATQTSQTSVHASDVIPTFLDSVRSHTLGFLCIAGAAVTIVEDGAWSRLLTPSTHASPDRSFVSSARAGADTTWGVSWTGASTYLYIAVEVLGMIDPQQRRDRR